MSIDEVLAFLKKGDEEKAVKFITSSRLSRSCLKKYINSMVKDADERKELRKKLKALRSSVFQFEPYKEPERESRTSSRSRWDF